MKRVLLPLLLVIAVAGTVRAQEETGALDWLTVDLWPDYDRPAVLVLLTGGLPAGVSLPATVTIPLPADATLNAVARITDDSVMRDDIVFDREAETLTLTTPERRFRVEYYQPYEADGLERQFSFRWQAPLAVNGLDVSVQQPQQALSLAVEPEAEQVIQGQDGLSYHTVSETDLAAGEPYEVALQYEMASAELTAGVPAIADDGLASDSPLRNVDEDGPDWVLLLAVAGGALIVGAVAWQVWTSRAAPARVRKPRTRTQHARFCHECGTVARKGDSFCRECGTRLKR